KIKVTVPIDESLALNLPEVKIGRVQTVQWNASGIAGNPELLVQVYSVFLTIPISTYLPVWTKPQTATLSDGSLQFTVDPETFKPDTWYIIRVWEANNEDIYGVSDPFL
ncbi:7675_t:CDS:2, partial [Acaulospora colombiana]